MYAFKRFLRSHADVDALVRGSLDRVVGLRAVLPAALLFHAEVLNTLDMNKLDRWGAGEYKPSPLDLAKGLIGSTRVCLTFE